ncbi:MAG: hypothetical protein WCW53_01240 [Syntrophales bacterium]
MAALLIGLYFSAYSTFPIIQIVGSFLLILAIIAIAVMAMIHCWRQPSRVSEITPSIECFSDGKRFMLTNPPDRIYNREDLRQLFRNFMVGYDDTLVSDGEIEGKAVDGKYRLYSPEEKDQWCKSHREEVSSIRNTAKKYLESYPSEEKMNSETDKSINLQQETPPTDFMEADKPYPIS